MNGIDWAVVGKVATIVAGIALYVWAQRAAIRVELERDDDDEYEHSSWL